MYFNIEIIKINNKYNNILDISTLRPYIYINNNIEVDKYWWELLNENQKNILINNFLKKNIKIIINDNFIKPHEGFLNNEIINFYNIYNNTFNMNYYIETINNKACIIELSNEEKRELISLFIIKTYNNKSNYIYDIFNNTILENLKIKILNKIDLKLKWFLRLNSNSAKQKKPITNFNDIIDILLTKSFINNEYRLKNKLSYLIFIPWNDNIIKKFEFKGFIHNKKFIIITQRFLYDKFNYKEKELDKIKYAIKNFNFNNIIYNSCCVDMYLDNEEFKIIKFNSLSYSNFIFCENYIELLYKSNNINIKVYI